MVKLDGNEFSALIAKDPTFMSLPKENIRVEDELLYALILDKRAFVPFVNWVEIYEVNEYAII